MLNAKLTLGAALTAVTLLAGAVSAATVSETFYLGGTGGNQTSHGFSSGDLNLTVTAFQHNQGVLGQQIKVNRSGSGLGAKSRRDQHLLDGRGQDEILLFDFGRKVTIEWIWFSHFDRFDDFELGAYSGTSLQSYQSDLPIFKAECIGACNNRHNDIGYANLAPAQRLMGRILGIGADHRSDQFKIKKIKVSYDDVAPVPLPASGLLLLAGLSGVGLMRRKKTKA